MAVLVTAWDIPGGEDHEDIGTYESVQITGNVIRDPDGDIIAERLRDDWYIGSPDIGTPGWQTRQRAWSDITIASVE